MKSVITARPYAGEIQRGDLFAIGAAVRSHIRNGNLSDAADALAPFHVLGARLDAEGHQLIAQAELSFLAALVTGYAYIRGGRDESLGRDARGFIANAITLNVSLGDEPRLGECFACIGEIEFYEARYDEAERLYGRALQLVKSSGEAELLLTIYYRLALVYWRRGALRRALGLLEEAVPLTRLSREPAITGNYHSTFALIYRRLGSPDEADFGYYDLSFLEYEAALYSYEQSSHIRHIASTKNNLAYIQTKRGMFEEAHELAACAHGIYAHLGEATNAAQVRETRAQIYLAENRLEDASACIESAIEVLSAAKLPLALIEALTTQGIIWARLGDHAGAAEAFDRGRALSIEAGDSFSEGRTILAYAEAFADKLEERELAGLCEQATRLLAHTQHAEIRCKLKRLRHSLRFSSYEKVLPFRSSTHKHSFEPDDDLSLIPARAKALGEYTVEIPDESLAHIGYPKGTRMVFHADVKPSPADVVAVYRRGRVYVGIYSEGQHLKTATGKKYPFTDFLVIGVA
jgi:tetratricopeptide (TPR) repeat protein